MTRTRFFVSVVVSALGLAGAFLACGETYDEKTSEDAGLPLDGSTAPDARSPVDAGSPSDASSGNDIEAPPLVDGGPLVVRPGACANAGSACLAVPTSWEGPFTWVDGDAGCPNDYASRVVDKHAEVDAATLPCQCGCAFEKGTGGAPRCYYRVSLGSGSTCGALDSVVRGTGECGTLSGGATSAHWMSYALVADAGTCLPTLDQVRPSQAWGRDVRLCSPPSSPEKEGCEVGELCTPTSQVVCIQGQGERPCPSGFPVRVVSYETVADTRKCEGNCGCSVIEPPKCTHPEVREITSIDSCFDGGVPVDAGACFTSTGTSIGYRLLGTAEGGTCSPEGDAGQTGGVTTTGASTLCCIR